MAETLERSVLERKERDELATIASALGMKPSGRAKKDTLIDQILKTAGVIPSEPARDTASVGDVVVKRPRGRPPKSASTAAVTPASPAAVATTADAAPADSCTPAAPAVPDPAAVAPDPATTVPPVDAPPVDAGPTT